MSFVGAYATNWSGFSWSASNTLPGDTTILTPWSVTAVLSPDPEVITVVNLPLQTRLVRFWTADASIRVALDVSPSVAPVLSDSLIDADAFVVGDTILQNQLYVMELHDDTLPHTVQLLSRDSSPQVLIVALLEA